MARMTAIAGFHSKNSYNNFREYSKLFLSSNEAMFIRLPKGYPTLNILRSQKEAAVLIPRLALLRRPGNCLKYGRFYFNSSKQLLKLSLIESILIRHFIDKVINAR